MKNMFGNYRYQPIAPQADTETLAEASPRLMFLHERNNEQGVKVFMAPKGILTAGWVIGIIDTLPVA